MLGVLLDAIEEVAATSLLPFFVEFGVEDGSECNTRHLREGPRQWNGITMDGSHENQDLNLFKRFVSAENVNALFQSLGVPRDPAVLSIDLDMNDFHVWRSILENGLLRSFSHTCFFDDPLNVDVFFVSLTSPQSASSSTEFSARPRGAAASLYFRAASLSSLKDPRY
jgi:hypothetical protein